MPADSSPRVLLFGVGSVGSVYLHLLSKVSSTTAVCRSNYDTVKANGFTLNSTIFGHGLRITPNVVRSCAEAATQDPRPFDYILVCSKAIPDTIPQLIAPAVTRGTTVIALLQNGIAIEEEYAVAFPENPIVTAAVYCKTTQRPAGVVAHDEIELLQLGSYPSSAPDTHALALTSLLRAAGATVEFYPDVQGRRWYKLLMNASWNPVCALTQCDDVAFMRSTPETATEFILDIMLEVRAVAKACGYEISVQEVATQLGRAEARIEKGNAVEPSMLQDVRAGRRMEVEAIVGNTVRLAREMGVGCGKLEVVYLLVRALDSQVGRGYAVVEDKRTQQE